MKKVHAVLDRVQLTGPLTFHEINIDNAALALGHPQSATPRQRALPRNGKRTTVPDQFGNDNFGFFATARYSALAGLFRIEMASTIRPRDCPLTLACRERRMRRKWSIDIFFQPAPRLNKEAAVNGPVENAYALVIGILDLRPSGNLLRQPVRDQFTRIDISQLTVHGKKTSLRAQR